MKKLVAASLVVLFGSTVAMAGHHPMAGCGLGYLLFKDDNTTGSQILAGTTNNIISPQTSAITSGTSGCTEKGLIAMNRQAEVYAEINLKELSREMSVGEGEYLNTFLTLLGVGASQKGAALTMVRDDYKTLFPSANVTSVEMMSSLLGDMQAHGITLG
jgi:hypothetical protein